MTIRDDGTPNAAGYSLKAEAPVLEIGDRKKGYKYPTVWVTERVEDMDGNYCGRTYIRPYPFSEMPDPEGWDALEFGSRYYMEAMEFTDASDHEARIECFQAAELFYLHAAERGNPYAWQNLGYIYSYDRCEGRYYKSIDDYESWEALYETPYPREDRAFACFTKAADAGVAEAMYKLGDLYKRGIGCKANAQEAFRWYERAFENGKDEEPYVWGSIALRLGDCYENAFGCEHSFEKALAWYEKAVTGLEIAVRDGDWFYRKALAGAENGVKRCRQEVALAKDAQSGA